MTAITKLAQKWNDHDIFQMRVKNDLLTGDLSWYMRGYNDQVNENIRLNDYIVQLQCDLQEEKNEHSKTFDAFVKLKIENTKLKRKLWWKHCFKYQMFDWVVMGLSLWVGG